VGFPLKLGLNVYYPTALVFLSQLFAFFIFDSILKKFGKNARLLFALFFWLNPWRASNTILWNPCYLFFASAVFFQATWKIRNSKNFFYSMIIPVSIAFAAQLHNSAIILAFLAMILYFKSKIKVSYPGLTLGICLSVLSFLPYLIFIKSNPSFGAANLENDAFWGKGALYVYPLIKSISYWGRYPSLYTSKNLHEYIAFSWIDVPTIKAFFHWTYHLLKWPLSIGSLVFAFFANYQYFKTPKNSQDEKWIFSFSLYAFIATLIAAGLSPIEFSHWHFFIVYAFSIFPVALYLEKINFLKNFKQAYKILTALIIWMMLQNIFGAMESRKHNFNASPQETFLKDMNTREN